jgi:uncharacterized protein
VTPVRGAFVLAIVLVLPLALPAAQAATYPDPQKAPRYFDSDCAARFDRRFVYDYVGLLTDDWGPLIEGAACEVYANTSAHFVLATVPDTGDESLESYSLHLFETWGIGSKDVNDGILLLYVDHYNLSGKSSALRVEVGYGLEGTLNAHVAANAIRLMQDTKAQALDAGRDDADAKSLAIANGAEYLLETMATDYTDGHFPAPQPASSAPPVWFWVVAVVVALGLLSALSRAAHGPRGWGYQTGSSAVWQGALAGAFARSVLRGGGGGGWGGGGFGGGGFGGGGFGGGRSGGGGGSGGF